MKYAPTVYIPTEPESNGLTLPMLLSLLAHGIVIGILIYTYQQPELDTVGSIETTMVTPSELAEMQEQILANRAATQAEAMNSDRSTATTEPMNDSNIGQSSIDQSNSESRRDSVFTRSDEPADSSVLMSQNYRQRLLEQNQEYERNIAELAAELDESALAELDQVQQEKQDELDEEQERLRSFRTKQNPIPRINRPTKDDDTIEIEKSSSGKTLKLSDGESKVSSSNSSSKSSRSTGDFKKGIANKIQKNLKAPTETQGLTAKVFLRLDARGRVLSAEARGSNAQVNAAAEKAAFDASPLPIDLDNPNDFSELSINVIVN